MAAIFGRFYFPLMNEFMRLPLVSNESTVSDRSVTIIPAHVVTTVALSTPRNQSRRPQVEDNS